jgi:hypothetical protein
LGNLKRRMYVSLYPLVYIQSYGQWNEGTFPKQECMHFNSHIPPNLDRILGVLSE